MTVLCCGFLRLSLILLLQIITSPHRSLPDRVPNAGMQYLPCPPALPEDAQCVCRYECIHMQAVPNYAMIYLFFTHGSTES